MVFIELEFEGNALLDQFQRKFDEVPDKLAEVINNSAEDGQGILMGNAPRDIGTLAGSHKIENRGLLERVIFPDEGIAPYALYVVLGHRTRLFRKSHGQQRWVPPNNYIKDSMPEIKSKVESNLEDFKRWLVEG